MLLAGDIGGTKTDLAIFSAEKGSRSPLAQARFHSADYPGLETIAREFLSHVNLPVSRGCFAVAGPVVGEVAARLAAAADRTPLILQAGLDSQEPCALCAATVRLFVSIVGAEAGNLALKLLATVGVYLGGGISPRILPALAERRFLEAFRRKGRLAELLARVPVHVITGTVALIGIVSCGLRLARPGAKA